MHITTKAIIALGLCKVVQGLLCFSIVNKNYISESPMNGNSTTCSIGNDGALMQKKYFRCHGLVTNDLCDSKHGM